MRKLFTATLPFLTAGALFLGTALAQQTPAKNTTPPAAKAQAPASGGSSSSTLTTEKQKLSYAIGMNIGKNLHRDAVDIDTNLLLQGMKDGLTGGQTLMTDQEAQAAVVELQTSLRKKQEEKAQAAGETNKKEGDAFLAANKTKPGVVTLPSGLQYKILTAGTGPKPTATDSVVCNYRGTLIDGTEFDSSYKRGQPATFPVNGVIKGWTEALQLMPVGSKWQLFVPPDLAYGARGAGSEIGPNSTLIFEVELQSIKPKGQ
ncbi:MAG: FKBP-type peptidyl-prolyl cis-trans isomerase [Candidatus Korobacteraceae bacterium]